MEKQKSEIQQTLENTRKQNGGNFLNPDNHDIVNINIGLLNIELVDKITQSVDNLVESNNESSKINKNAIFWSKILTIALITVTLIVGLLQVYIIAKKG